MKLSLAVGLFAALAVARPRTRQTRERKWVDWDEYGPEYEEDEVIEGNKGNGTIINPSQPPLADANMFTDNTLLMTTTANGTVTYQQFLHDTAVTIQSTRSCAGSNQALKHALKACQAYALKAKTVIENSTDAFLGQYFTNGNNQTRALVSRRFATIAEECGRGDTGMMGIACEKAQCDASSDVAHGISYTSGASQSLFCPLFFSYYDMDEFILTDGAGCLKPRDRLTHGTIMIMHAGFAAAGLQFHSPARVNDAHSYATFAFQHANPCTSVR